MELPAISLVQLDSTTVFNIGSIAAGKPIVLFYFRPYCKHCRQETEDILTHYEDFKDAELVFVSADELSEVQRFANYYNLTQYKNIKTLWDKDFNFQRSFKPRAIPYKIVYDGSKKLVRSFNGDSKWTLLLAATKGS